MVQILVTLSDKVYEIWKSNKVADDYKRRLISFIQKGIVDSIPGDDGLGIVIRTKTDIAQLEILTIEEYNERYFNV